MRRFASALALAAATALLTAGLALGSEWEPGDGGGSWTSNGNTKCSDLGLGSVVKFEPARSGTREGITVSVDGLTFDWSLDGTLLADFGLHAPVNPKNGKFYGLSHIEFCSNVEGDVQTVIVKGGPNASVYDYFGGFSGE